jgi:flagellin-like protein
VKRPRSHVGVSEIVATIILVAMTLFGFGLYYGVIQRNVSLETLGPIQQYQASQHRAGEQVGLAYALLDHSTDSTDLFVISYGLSPVSVSTIVLTPNPGGGDPASIPAASLTMMDPATGVTRCAPTGPYPICGPTTTLYQGSTTEIEVGAEVAPPMTVALITTDNAVFEWSG